MLILKRRREQLVRIGPDITVTVLAIQNGAVTLAVDAPSSLKISREHSPLNGVNTYGSSTICGTGNDGLPGPSEFDEAPRRDVPSSQGA